MTEQNLSSRYRLVVGLFFISLLAFVVLSLTVAGPTVVFLPLSVEETAQHFFRFLVLALLVERVIEVLVLAAWREGPIGDPLAKEKDPQVTIRKQRVAHLIGFVVGGTLGLSGFRVLEPLLDADVLQGFEPSFQSFLVMLDVIFTACLLTGGADGLHRIIESVQKGLKRD